MAVIIKDISARKYPDKHLWKDFSLWVACRAAVVKKIKRNATGKMLDDIIISIIFSIILFDTDLDFF